MNTPEELLYNLSSINQSYFSHCSNAEEFKSCALSLAEEAQLLHPYALCKCSTK